MALMACRILQAPMAGASQQTHAAPAPALAALPASSGPMQMPASPLPSRQHSFGGGRVGPAVAAAAEGFTARAVSAGSQAASTGAGQNGGGGSSQGGSLFKSGGSAGQVGLDGGLDPASTPEAAGAA